MKKAQAATETIATYGWAILVVLIVMVSLAYFGVLDPGAFFTAQCSFPPGITCLDASASSSSSEIRISIKNSYPYELLDFSIIANKCQLSSDVVSLKPNEQRVFVISSCQLSQKQKYSGSINASYVNPQSMFNHKEYGSLVLRVE